MASNMILSLFGYGPKAPINPPNFPYDVKTNPYRAKRQWPPDYSQLSQKHQFLLERRYRRRSQLKWARPTWKKATKLVQWGSILFVVVYGVLYLDMNEFGSPDRRDPSKEKRPDRRTVFDDLRQWYSGQMSDFRGLRDGAGSHQDGNKESSG